MVVSVNSRGTLTLPSDIRKKLNIKEGDHFQIDIKAGKIIITPVVIVPKAQLSEKGKLKEKQASEDIKLKRVKSFETSEALLKELDELDNKACDIAKKETGKAIPYRKLRKELGLD